jgi:hypothetical protein
VTEPTHQPPTGTDGATDRPPDDEAGPARTPRPAWVAAGVVVVLAIALVAVAYVPRTVAAGGHGEQTWRVTVAPGVMSPTIRLVDAQGNEQRAGGFGPRPTLDATRVWAAPSDATGTPVTVVVGPTPAGTDSVRVTSDVRGVGEATLRRVAWRRVHVTAITGDAFIEELVAIGEDGRVLDAVSDLGLPVDAGEPSMDAAGRRASATPVASATVLNPRGPRSPR